MEHAAGHASRLLLSTYLRQRILVTMLNVMEKTPSISSSDRARIASLKGALQNDTTPDISGVRTASDDHGEQNVFRDLGFREDEAVNLKHRARLMHSLKEYIGSRGLTQQEAAKKMDVTQPRISDLVNLKVDRFTIDSLVNMADAIGLHVEVGIVNEHG